MDNIQKYFIKNKEITVVLDSNNSKWYHALTVCEILEHKNTSELFLSDKIKKYIKKYRELFSDNKIEPRTKFVSEPGLYRLIFCSTQENAVDFQDWVFEEVLPKLQENKEYVLSKKSAQKYIKN